MTTRWRDADDRRPEPAFGGTVGLLPGRGTCRGLVAGSVYSNCYVQRSMLDGVRDVQLLILTALAAEPMHGHRMQAEIEALSGRPVGPGTLYGAINRLEDDGFIRPGPPRGRRRPYELTDEGRRRLAQDVARARHVVDTAQQRLGGGAWTA